MHRLTRNPPLFSLFLSGFVSNRSQGFSVTKRGFNSVPPLCVDRLKVTRSNCSCASRSFSTNTSPTVRKRSGVQPLLPRLRRTAAISCPLTDGKRNPQKRKKEKLPVDVLPPPEESSCVKAQQVVAMTSNIKSEDAEASLCPAEMKTSTHGEHAALAAGTKTVHECSSDMLLFRSGAAARQVCEDQRRRRCCGSEPQVRVCASAQHLVP